MTGKFVIVILLAQNVLILNVSCQWGDISNILEKWNGSWFPVKPGEVDNHFSFKGTGKYNVDHEVPMGVSNFHCDDAETGLEMDWDGSPLNYTCFDFGRSFLFRPRSGVKSLYTSEPMPKMYRASHRCMNHKIEYDSSIPTFGSHRPLWAKYGEYVFLPKQRWLHNLEHGAIVMLYHPCASKNEVNILRILLKKCLYRHIITPYNLLTPERPLALVSWGHRLEMSKVDVDVVVNFIKTHALKGQEKITTDGQYNLMLVEHADILNDDIQDSQLCKFHVFM